MKRTTETSHPIAFLADQFEGWDAADIAGQIIAAEAAVVERPHDPTMRDALQFTMLAANQVLAGRTDEASVALAASLSEQLISQLDTSPSFGAVEIDQTTLGSTRKRARLFNTYRNKEDIPRD